MHAFTNQLITGAKSESVLSRVGARNGIRPMEINKTAIITRCRFDTSEPFNTVSVQ